MTRKQRRSRQKLERHGKVALGGGFVLAATLVSGSVAHADQFAVTNLNTYGTGSLRQAVYDSQNNPGPDSIVFQSDLSGTIGLYSYGYYDYDGCSCYVRQYRTGLHVDQILTITGPASGDVTIDAQGESRILAATGGAPVSLSNLRFTHGYSYGDPKGGGALYSDGPLTLDHVRVDNSYGGAGGGGVSAQGGATITNSQIDDNYTYGPGGGLVAPAGASISDSSITDNRAYGLGGGLDAGDAVQVVRSTVAGNLGYDGGGGIAHSGGGRLDVDHSTVSGNRTGSRSYGQGGGIWEAGTSGGNAYIEDSTVAQNQVYGGRGGGVNSYGPVTAIGSTIANNASSNSIGGIYASANVLLENSIVAANAGSSDVYSGGTVSAAFSLVQSAGYAGVQDTVAGSNIIGQDPQLGPLQDNGGPTFTMKPGSTSPVIDKGSAFGQTDDQRGLTRPFDQPDVANSTAAGADGSDMGAVELQDGDVPPPMTFNVTNTNDDGDGSLRQAILDADANPGDDTILFDSTLTGTITLQSNLPDVTDGVTITGPGSAKVTVDGGTYYSLFNITEGSQATITGLTLTDGHAADDGGAIASDVPLTLNDIDATYNNSQSTGGAISATDGLEITDSSVSDNTVPSNGQGGGIWTEGDVTVTRTTIDGNNAYSGAGLFHDGDGTLTVTHSTVSGNRTATYGNVGGIETRGSGATVIEDSTIANNRSFSGGGGIDTRGPVTITGSTIAGNSALNWPGGIYASGAAAIVTLQNSIVAGNSDGNNGDIDAQDGASFSAAFSLIQSPRMTEVTDTVPGSNITGKDPKLGALADNGGPTETMKPARTSPVVDKGSSFAEMDDQRGQQRPFDQPLVANSTADGADGSDMGAVELQDGDVPAPDPMTFHVTNTNDGGDGSLRQAMLDAESNPGDDTILFDSDLTGTISLASDLPALDEGVTITGPGSGKVTVDGGTYYSLFNITEGSQATITGLTLTDGRADDDGGAIASDVPLTLDDVDATYNISGDAGGAISATDGLVVTDSRITNNQASHYAPGISATGDVTVTGTTIDGNDTANVHGHSGGGGILHTGGGTLTVDHSTVSNNEAPTGGGIDEQGQDGGSVVVTDSTIAGNHAPLTGGGIASYGPVTLTGSTVAGNYANGYDGADSSGGGIYMDGATATLQNTIVGYNENGDLAAVNGGSFSASFSLVQNPAGLITDDGSDILDQDPQLGPLQDNGGPTQTMRPASDSPVIDQGKAFGLTDDQRGKPRPADQPDIDDSTAPGADGSDMGAVELQAADIPHPTTFHVTNTNDAGDGSLRQAMLDAESNFGDDTILFDSDVSGTINLASPLPDLDESVTITGPGADAVTVDAGGDERIFNITYGDDFTISGLTLTNGYADGPGGAIYSVARLTLDHVAVTDSGVSESYGGGVASRNDLLVHHSTFSGNATHDGGPGGAIHAEGALQITDSTISGNSADGSTGGGVWARAELTVGSSTIASNSADSGGGILAEEGLGQIEDSTIRDNTGGGLEAPGVKLTDSTVSGNSGSSGGGLLITATGGGIGGFGGTQIVNSTISGNTASSEGGGIFTNYGASITGSTIAGNHSTGDGGGIQAGGYGNDPVTLRDTIVGANTSGSSPDDLGTHNSTPFHAGFSLIQAAGDATVDETIAGSNITGQDPDLGALQDNGGDTETMAPAPDSPVVDKGKSYELGDDQRSRPRPVDTPSIPNSAASGSDGSDIGAVELDAASTGPVVSSISPGSGPAGTSVVITGKHFTGVTKVLFGSASASFQVDSDTQITVDAPAGTGTVDVEVENPKASSALSAADKFTYTAASGGGGGGGGGGSDQQQQQQEQTPPPAPPPPANGATPGKLSIGTSGGATLRKRSTGLVLFPGISISCPSGATDCTASAIGSIDIGAARKQTWVKARLTVDHGGVQAISFKLSSRAQRILNRERKLTVTIVVTAKLGDGTPVTATKKIVVHAKPKPKPKRRA